MAAATAVMSQGSTPPFATTPSTSKTSPRSSTLLTASKENIPSFPNASSTSLASAGGESTVPQFKSSLPYTEVRDFAYPSIHPLHYGPQPKDPADESRSSSQLFDYQGGGGWGHGFGRRASDPSHSGQGGGSDWDSFWETDATEFIDKPYPPPLRFEDGPPWSEDEDLQSPVVRPSRHRRNKTDGSSTGRGRLGDSQRRKSEYVTRGHGSGGMGITRAQSQIYGAPAEAYYQASGLPYHLDDSEYDNAGGANEWLDDNRMQDESRLSQEFWVSIGSPEEEMHGKAVALFDFARENDNELELVEGQVIWVSYRHGGGMGWLVAQDPKTGDTGLVPEEYVRLLRDIQEHELDPEGEFIEEDPILPSAEENASSSSPVNKSTPIISKFSTSSKDIYPYPIPAHLSADQTPPNPEQYRNSGSALNAVTQEERVKQIQKERERALLEEDSDTPRLSGRKYSAVSAQGEDDELVTPIAAPQKETETVDDGASQTSTEAARKPVEKKTEKKSKSPKRVIADPPIEFKDSFVAKVEEEEEVRKQPEVGKSKTVEVVVQPINDKNRPKSGNADSSTTNHIPSVNGNSVSTANSISERKSK